VLCDRLQVIAVPYHSLFHKPTRDSLRLRIKDCVVIVDEAHNIVDTINSIHSVELSCAQALQASSLLSSYVQAASTAAIKGGYLNRDAELFERTRQIVSLLKCLADYLEKLIRTATARSSESPPPVSRRDSDITDAVLDCEGTCC